ncbi:MAG: carboxymuconolactone decarboxylase family protein [Chloroflexi bacterium]|nr:carboxymuconolactone decarboxylase family protein [Chloroflexota bacterium]
MTEPAAEQITTLTPTNEHSRRAFEYLQANLGIKMPQFWAELAEARPEAMAGYLQLRQHTMRDTDEGAALPKKIKELALVAENIIKVNPWAVKVHTKAAIRAGATLDELWEVIVLVIAESGMILYKMAGYDAVLAAREAVEGIRNGVEDGHG